jgi:hypothetical protein
VSALKICFGVRIVFAPAVRKRSVDRPRRLASGFYLRHLPVPAEDQATASKNSAAAEANYLNTWRRD